MTWKEVLCADCPFLEDDENAWMKCTGYHAHTPCPVGVMMRIHKKETNFDDWLKINLDREWDENQEKSYWHVRIGEINV